MNNGVRIVLDRHEGGRWLWTLTVRGEQHTSNRSEQTAELAAQAAETFRNHLYLVRDFKSRRPGNAQPQQLRMTD